MTCDNCAILAAKLEQAQAEAREMRRQRDRVIARIHRRSCPLRVCRGFLEEEGKWDLEKCRQCWLAWAGGASWLIIGMSESERKELLHLAALGKAACECVDGTRCKGRKQPDQIDCEVCTLHNFCRLRAGVATAKERGQGDDN